LEQLGNDLAHRLSGYRPLGRPMSTYVLVRRSHVKWASEIPVPDVELLAVALAKEYRRLVRQAGDADYRLCPDINEGDADSGPYMYP
jgi:hypothetical protein